MNEFKFGEEISEYQWNPAEREGNIGDGGDAEAGLSKKSSRKLPEVWTRVISLFGDDLTRVKAH